MKKRINWSLTLILIFIFINTCIVSGSDTATQNVSITVEAINEISVSSNEVSLVINATSANVSAGEALFSVSDSSTTLSYTTNESGKKISASLDSEFTDIVLEISVSSSSGISNGSVQLTTNPIDIITGLGNSSDSNESVTYTATAVPNTSPNMGELHTVTFTLTDS